MAQNNSAPKINSFETITKTPASDENINSESEPGESLPVEQPTPGDFKTNKPNFPSFYFWKCYSNTTPRQGYGNYKFEVYLINKNGKITKENCPGQKYPSPEGGFFDKPDSNKKEWASFDGKWLILLKNSDDESFILRNNSTQEPTKILNPSGEGCSPFCFYPLCWSPKKDFFYFQSIQGDSTSRSLSLLQFDPNIRNFIEICGRGWHFNISPDGNWVVWSEGAADMVGGEIHLYDVQKNIDYAISSDAPYDIFYKWCYADTDEARKEIDSFIKKGKQLFLNHQFSDAIQEYKKAIEIDPANSLAYGYMGYSAFRMGNIQKAIHDLEESVEFDHSNKMSYFNLALAYWVNDQKDRAISALRPVYYMNIKMIHDDPQFKEIITSPEFIKAFGH